MRHVAVATEQNGAKKWRGKKTKKPRKVPHVNVLSMGITGFSLDYSFIIDILEKGVKPKKPYQTCSPSELVGWEKKQSKKLPKRKHQENIFIRIRKVKMKRKKKRMRTTTHPQLLVFGRKPFDFS